MITLVVWLVAALVVLIALDRLLLRLEARGWINYRRHGLSRGGSTYHVLELQSFFNPSTREVMEVKYEQREEQDESGAPHGKDREDRRDANAPEDDR